MVARVLESFTDQDRLEYAEKLYTVNLRANLLHDTNGKTGPGCTPFRGTRSYALQHLLHSSRDRDPGDGSRLSGRGGEPPDELVFPDSALRVLPPVCGFGWDGPLVIGGQQGDSRSPLTRSLASLRLRLAALGHPPRG